MFYLELDDIIFNMQKFGGASTYWLELSKRLISHVPGPIAHATAKKWMRLFSPTSTARVFHSSHFRIARTRGVKNVVTIHDLIYEKGLGGGRGRVINLVERRRAVERADAIICISESTKKDLLAHYPAATSSKPIHVIYHGCTALPRSPQGQHGFYKTLALQGMHLEDGNFFMFVGGRGGYKNFELVLHAFLSGKFADSGYFIVCTGSPFSESERTLIDKLGLRGSVLSVGLLDFALLGELYAVARALVYPSLYEGFGLPPLEAMASGCPVICSRTSSLPEVVAGDGLLIEPMSVQALVRAMQSVLFDKVRQELVASGLRRAKFFDWDKSAHQHAGVYKSVAPF